MSLSVVLPKRGAVYHLLDPEYRKKRSRMAGGGARAVPYATALCGQMVGSNNAGELETRTLAYFLDNELATSYMTLCRNCVGHVVAETNQAVDVLNAAIRLWPERSTE